MVEYPSISWKPEKLQEALKSHDNIMKIGAIRALQETPKDEYVRTLIEVLNDHDRLVRINAAIALGKIKNPLAVIALVYHIVSDEDKDVQLYSLWAYRQIDYAKASPRLVKILLESNNEAMKKFAAAEIRQKGDIKSIESLIQRFQNNKFYSPYDLDIRAIDGLYYIGYSTVEPLVKCLDSEDLRVKANAIYALGRIGDERAIQPLINHLSGANIEIRSRISDALIKIGRASIPALIRLLDDKDREIRWIAAYSIGKIGSDAGPVLLKAFEARGSNVTEDMIYALGIVGGKSSFEPIYNVYASIRNESIRAWSIISMANIISAYYQELKDKAQVNNFLDSLGEQLKPHMLLGHDALYSLGKVYIMRASVGDVESFKANMGTAVKCFDLSIIERENVKAKVYRLLYGSYLKLMSSKSPEIMNYIERDFVDLKKDAEKVVNKKEIIYLLDRALSILRAAYGDKNFNYAEKFKEYTSIGSMMEEFLIDTEDVIEEHKKPNQKELAMLHTDIEIIQGKINAMLTAFSDENMIAQTYRLSTEMAKLDTGMYDDYRVIESCLKNIVAGTDMSNDEKSDLYFKILLISKNGTSQIELVLDQILKNAKGIKTGEKKENVQVQQPVAKEKSGNKRKIGILEYIIIIVLVILIVAAVIIALNKFGYIKLPFRLPISWMNPAVIDMVMLGGGTI